MEREAAELFPKKMMRTETPLQLINKLETVSNRKDVTEILIKVYLTQSWLMSSKRQILSNFPKYLFNCIILPTQVYLFLVFVIF